MGTGKKRTGTGQKKRQTAPGLSIIIAVVLVLAVGMTALFDREKGDAADTKTGQIIAEGESLIIPISELSATAQFYPVSVNGTEMEVLAILDSTGGIRTAFNTCQICYSSGRGYYVQDGSDLVCQNCGNRFTADQVETESGGCNPWPIFSESKTVSDDSISISYEELSKAARIFAR